MKQEAEKYGIRQVLSNNLFLLKQIGKVSPWRIPAIMIDAVADWSKGLIFRVFVVGYVLNQIQASASIQKIFPVVGLLSLLSFACHLVNILYEELLFSPIRSEDSVPLHEADVWQGTGGRPGML